MEVVLVKDNSVIPFSVYELLYELCHISMQLMPPMTFSYEC